MRLIIAGSRTVSPTIAEIDRALVDRFTHVTEVVSGSARGADFAGEEWALYRGILLKEFPADWTAHGKVAGKLRNRAMAHYADAALVFWDGMSSGSADMVCRMVARGKPVHVVPMKAGK